MSRSKSRRAAKRKEQGQAATQQGLVGQERRQPSAPLPAMPAFVGPVASATTTRTPAHRASEPGVPNRKTGSEKDDAQVVQLGNPAAGGVSSADYASVADGLMREYQLQNDFKGLTTTKLRRIYALIMNLYTRAGTPEDFKRCASDVQYLKVRMAYEAGRDTSVRDFLERTHLMSFVDETKDYDQFGLYCRYAEALVAYFKFYGGKDS